MPTPQGVLWARDPHTGAKHDLLRHYLSAWLPVLLPTFRRVTYAEGFSGPGIYEAGEPGSPVIALEVVNSHRALFHSGRRMDLLFVEEHKGRHERLIQELDGAVAHMPGLPPAVIVHPPARADCAEALPRLLDGADAWGMPMFVMLDSFGGPDVPHDLLKRVAASKAGEVLVTFGPTFLARFGAGESSAAQGDAAYGDCDWRGVFTQPSECKHAFLVEEYRQSLRKAGFAYVLAVLR